MALGNEDSVKRAAREDVSLLGLASMLLRQRRLLVRLPLALFLVVVVVSLLLPRSYTSRGIFMPFAGQGIESRAAGIAAQFGFALPGQEPGQSPEFYVELIRTRDILGRLVDSQYEFVATRGMPFARDTARMRGNLVEILEIEEPTPARSREKAMKAVSDMLSISTGALSGTITVQVTTKWPELSRQLATRALELVDEFNRTRRRSQAATERTFVEERLAEAQKQLRVSEDRVERFLRDNRTFASSPQLVFEHDRLQRDVGLRQQVMLGLTQAHEQARIDEVRNTPVITIVQSPEAPAIPDRRRLLLKGLAALVVGFMLAVGIALFREILLITRRSDASGVEEFDTLKQETLSEVRRPWRLLLGGGDRISSRGATAR